MKSALKIIIPGCCIVAFAYCVVLFHQHLKAREAAKAAAQPKSASGNTVPTVPPVK